jgi:hypothetical protein
LYQRFVSTGRERRLSNLETSVGNLAGHRTPSIIESLLRFHYTHRLNKGGKALALLHCSEDCSNNAGEVGHKSPILQVDGYSKLKSRLISQTTCVRRIPYLEF